MARRTSGSEPGRRPASSTESRKTSSEGRHIPVPSMGPGGPHSTTSTVASRASGTSKERGTVRGSPDPVGTVSKAEPLISASSKERGTTAVKGGRYGRHDTTPLPIHGLVRSPSQTGPTVDPRNPNEARRILSEPGPPRGSEESFIDAAASARRARLKHEALVLAAISTRPPPISRDTPAYELPEETDETESSKPRRNIAPSAAERVRSVMSPSSRATQRLKDTSNHESAKGRVAQ